MIDGVYSLQEGLEKIAMVSNCSPSLEVHDRRSRLDGVIANSMNRKRAAPCIDLCHTLPCPRISAAVSMLPSTPLVAVLVKTCLHFSDFCSFLLITQSAGIIYLPIVLRPSHGRWAPLYGPFAGLAAESWRLSSFKSSLAALNQGTGCHSTTPTTSAPCYVFRDQNR